MLLEIQLKVSESKKGEEYGMKRKMMTIFLGIAVLIICLAGCGGKDEQKVKEPEKQTEGTADDKDKAGTAEDAEKETEAEKTDAEEEEINEYGLTDSQQKALLESVKTSVTENYLKPYNIAPADFKLLPYDADDLKNYTESGEYTGTDPNQCAELWNRIDTTITQSNDMLGTRLAMALSLYSNGESYADAESDTVITFEETMEAQNKKSIEESGGVSFTDTDSQTYALQDAVYKGIADFMNGLEEKERYIILYNLYKIKFENEELIELGGTGFGRTVSSTTMFDKVISENIQFE